MTFTDTTTNTSYASVDELIAATSDTNTPLGAATAQYRSARAEAPTSDTTAPLLAATVPPILDQHELQRLRDKPVATGVLLDSGADFTMFREDHADAFGSAFVFFPPRRVTVTGAIAGAKPGHLVGIGPARVAAPETTTKTLQPLVIPHSVIAKGSSLGEGSTHHRGL